MVDEINTWFALRIQNRQMKRAMQWRVNIMVARHMSGMWLVCV